MGSITLEGSISAGPLAGNSGSFPSATFNAALQFSNGNPRSYGAASGLIARAISSPSAFIPLGGVGTSSDVTTADFLYLESNGPIDVQIVAQDGNGGFTTVVITVSGGPLLLPVSPTKLITAVNVKGSAQIQYFASGPA